MDIPKSRFEWTREYPKTDSRIFYHYNKEMADKVTNAAIGNLNTMLNLLTKLTKSLSIK